MGTPGVFRIQVSVQPGQGQGIPRHVWATLGTKAPPWPELPVSLLRGQLGDYLRSALLHEDAAFCDECYVQLSRVPREDPFFDDQPLWCAGSADDPVAWPITWEERLSPTRRNSPFAREVLVGPFLPPLDRRPRGLKWGWTIRVLDRPAAPKGEVSEDYLRPEEPDEPLLQEFRAYRAAVRRTSRGTPLHHELGNDLVGVFELNLQRQRLGARGRFQDSPRRAKLVLARRLAISPGDYRTRAGYGDDAEPGPPGERVSRLGEFLGPGGGVMPDCPWEPIPASSSLWEVSILCAMLLVRLIGRPGPMADGASADERARVMDAALSRAFSRKELEEVLRIFVRYYREILSDEHIERRRQLDEAGRWLARVELEKLPDERLHRYFHDLVRRFLVAPHDSSLRSYLQRWLEWRIDVEELAREAPHGDRSRGRDGGAREFAEEDSSYTPDMEGCIDLMRGKGTPDL